MEKGHRRLETCVEVMTELREAADDVEAVSITGDSVGHDPRRDFAAFYRFEHPVQVRRAYLMTGSRATAHELVHDAFVGLLERWETVEQPGAYLNRSVTNACRRHGRRRRDSEAQVLDLTDTAGPIGGGTEGVEIADLLLALPFRQRAAIVLRFYAGLTENEIAAALDCRPGTIGPAIHRGLAKLKEALE